MGSAPPSPLLNFYFRLAASEGAAAGASHVMSHPPIPLRPRPTGIATRDPGTYGWDLERRGGAWSLDRASKPLALIPNLCITLRVLPACLPHPPAQWSQSRCTGRSCTAPLLILEKLQTHSHTPSPGRDMEAFPRRGRRNWRQWLSRKEAWKEQHDEDLGQ